MGLSVSRDVCKCTDLTAGIRVDFEAKEAAEDHPEGWFGASREPSTSYDGGHTDLPAKARYFLTQSTAISRKMFAPEVQGAFLIRSPLYFTFPFLGLETIAVVEQGA